MTNFVCAVADCKSNSTFSVAKHSFMKQVKGWARFPFKKKDAKRRRLWEKRCRRGDEWRATKNNAICSRHFLSWEKNHPSPQHPDPVLFLYNGWGKNCPDTTTRKPNRAQIMDEPSSSGSDNVINSDSETPLEDAHHVLLTDDEETLQISGSIQDWSEVEVCSEESSVASVNSGMLQSNCIWYHYFMKSYYSYTRTHISIIAVKFEDHSSKYFCVF